MAHTRRDEMSLAKRTLWSELRVIWIIAVKSLKINARYRIDFILGTIIPLTLIISLAQNIFQALTFGPTEGLQEYIGTLDYASFGMISFIFWEYYLTVITGGRRNMRSEQMMGTLELAYTCPVKRPILLAGFCLSNFITFLPAVIATFISAFLMGVRLNTTLLNVSLAFVAFVLGMGGCFGFGFILAGLVVKYREPGILDAVLVHPLWYFSGVLYVVTVLPVVGRFVAYLLPTSYGLDSVRGLLLRTKTILPINYELLVMATFTVLSPLVGVLIFNKLEKDVMKKGGIGAY